MGFAAALPFISAGLGAAGSLGGAKGGGKGGGGGADPSFNQTNFLPFQQPSIDRVFDILGGGAGEAQLLGGTGRDSLLQVPPQASSALGNALDFTNDLFSGRDAGTQGLQNFESLLNDQLGQQPFESTIDDISDLRDSIEQRFDPFINRAFTLSEEGVDPRFGNLLEGFANEDPFSNPFVDRITSDALTDQRAAALDAATRTGGLSGSGFAQNRQREAGRLSADIRGRFGEASRQRALQAAQAGGQFDAANVAAKLQALIGGGNLASQSFQGQLGAQGQINQLTQADVNRRLNLVGQRGNTAQALANLPLAGLNAVGPLANAFTELPFVPLSNFAALAGANLGGSRINIDEGGGGKGGGLLGTIDPLLSGALGGLGLGQELGGLFGDGDDGGTPLIGGAGGGSSIFASNPFGSTTGQFGGGLFT